MKTLTLAVALTMGLLLCCTASAADRETAEAAELAQAVDPIYETKDSWEFDKKDELVFHNDSPNPDGSRFLVWKGYTWIVMDKQIMILDGRPHGTQLKGERHQLQKKDKRLSDKELMNDLKRQASEVREASSGQRERLPVRFGVGFGYSRGRWGTGVGVSY